MTMLGAESIEGFSRHSAPPSTSPYLWVSVQT